MTKLVLASQSLGRKKLLEYLNIPFEIIPSSVNEEKIIGRSPLDTLKLRARLKAESIFPRLKRTDLPRQTFLLSADSGAILDNQLIGKPKDKKDAVRILSLLSGRTHEFVTAVYIIKISTNRSKAKEVLLDKTSKSFVTFRKLSREDIDFYLSKTDFRRFAAAYAVASAQDFITQVKGSISNVIGLPLEHVIPIIKKLDRG